MDSKTYWKNRETANLKSNLKTEAEYAKEIENIYSYMMDQITKEINGFYTKYASAEGITMSEAKKKVAKLDIEEYERKAAKYVKDKTFTSEANEEMRLYNATMKINRLEMLKANIGLEMVDGFNDLQQYFDQVLTERTLSEFERQAGILGNTIQNNAKMAESIVNASFKNARFSDRVWMYQDMLKSELSKLLQEGLIQGRNPKQLATHLEKVFGVSQYNAERLMRTELARVQTDAQKQSFIANGFDEYQFNALGTACEICAAIDGKHFKVKDMMPGTNAPPMHPNCRCSTSAYMDDKEYNQWLDTYQEHGLSFEDWKNNVASNGGADIIANKEPIVFSDSDDAEKYFKENGINEWVDSLTDYEAGSIGEYTGSGFQPMNGFLRGTVLQEDIDYCNKWYKEHTKELPISVQERISRVESALNRYELNDNITVYRGFNLSAIPTECYDVGSEWIQKGFTSTSVLKEIAEGNDALAIINIPSGKGIGSYINDISYHRGECEFLINKDSTLVLKDIVEREDGVTELFYDLAR